MTCLDRRALLAAPLILAASRGHGQEAWAPSRPVRFIVTFAAGGSADVLARKLAEPLRAALGQPVVIENRPGAGGNVGLAELARAAPDGHAIGLGAPGPLAINRAIASDRQPFDAAADFTPISLLAEQPNLMLAHPSVSAAPLGAFAEWLKANPGTPFGSPGAGTSNHVTGLAFAAALGAPVAHVAYRGSAPAQTDLLAGHIKLMVDNIAGNVLALVREGRLKAVAVSTAARSALLPDVPSMTEAGTPALASWQGLLGPRGLPAPVRARFHAEVTRALRDPSVEGWLRENGAEPVGGAPEAFEHFLAGERAKWAGFVKAFAISAE